MDKNNSIDTSGFEKIDELYRKLGYFQRYGGTIILVIIISIIVIETFIFFQILNYEREIKDDWINQRCKPYIMPIAGFINKPDGQTIIDYTGNNFTYCIQEITKTISGKFFSPFNSITGMVTGIVTFLSQNVQSIRYMINQFRNSTSFITRSIMDRIANVVIPLQVFFITFRDFASKTNAVMIDASYLIVSVYYTLMALANKLNSLFLLDIDIPSPNVCFDEDTIIKLQSKEHINLTNEIRIKDIQVGDVLHDGSIITAKLRLENPYDTIYSFEYEEDINNNNDKNYKKKTILVTGNHRVMYNNELIYVKEHPNVKEVNNYNKPYLYCMNTTSKRIVIGDYIFADWDDLSDKDIKNIVPLFQKDTTDLSYIHSMFDGGFHPETQVDVFTKGDLIHKNIKDIDIGDIIDLEKQTKVYGVVEILVDKNDKLYEYIFKSSHKNIHKNDYENIVVDSFVKIKGGNHMILNNGQKTEKLVRYNCNSIHGKQNEKEICKIYHLLTTNKSFSINNIEFKDYNSCIENI